MAAGSASARGIPGVIWAIVIFGSLSSAGFGFDSGWWSGIMSSSQFARTFGSFDPVQQRWSLTSNQQAQGISFVANYQAVFLQQIGFKEVLLLSVVVYVIGIAANLISMFTTDRLGRRSVLLYAAGLLRVCMLVIGGLTAHGAAGMSYAMQVAMVVMLMLWFFCFQITWGPLPWVLAAEVPPAQVREKMVSLTGFAGYGTGRNCVCQSVHAGGD